MLPSLLVVGLLVQRSLQEDAARTSSTEQISASSLSTTPGSLVGQVPSPAITSNTIPGSQFAATTTASIVVVPPISTMVSQASDVPSTPNTNIPPSHGDPDNYFITPTNLASYSTTDSIPISWKSRYGGCTLAIEEVSGYRLDVRQSANITHIGDCSTAGLQSWIPSSTNLSYTNTGATYVLVLRDDQNYSLLSPLFSITMNTSMTSSTPAAAIPTSATSAAGTTPTFGAASASPAPSGMTSGLSQPAKIGLGVGLGLGIPLIVAAILGAMFALRKKKRFPNDPNYDQYHDTTPSHEDVAAMGYSKGMDASPPLPPLPPQPESTTVPGAGGVAASQLGRLDTSMPPVTPGLGGSPVSPLSHRSSVSSMSTIGPNTRAPTMTSVHH